MSALCPSLGIEAPPEVRTVVEALTNGFYDLLRLLSSHVSAEQATELAGTWLQQQRWHWVGDALGVVVDPMCEVDSWPAPPGGGLWRDDPLFQGDPLTDEDWARVEATAAEFRATVQ